MIDYAEDLDELVRIDRNAIQTYSLLAAVAIGVGVFVAIGGSTGSVPGSEGSRSLAAIGGAAIVAMSAFPIREYVRLSSRVRSVRQLKTRWLQIGGLGDITEDDRRMVGKMILELYGQGAKR